jgi:hypothetical protein
MAERRTAIHFFCDNGSCKSESRSKKFTKPAVVTLIADGTDVTLRFARSPFVSGDKVIQIPADTFVKEKLAGTSGTFKYSVSCSACSSGNDDAEFILGL